MWYMHKGKLLALLVFVFLVVFAVFYFVQPILTSPSISEDGAQSLPTTAVPIYEATFDFMLSVPAELELREGELVTLLLSDTSDLEDYSVIGSSTEITLYDTTTGQVITPSFVRTEDFSLTQIGYASIDWDANSDVEVGKEYYFSVTVTLADGTVATKEFAFTVISSEEDLGVAQGSTPPLQQLQATPSKSCIPATASVIGTGALDGGLEHISSHTCPSPGGNPKINGPGSFYGVPRGWLSYYCFEFHATANAQGEGSVLDLGLCGEKQMVKSTITYKYHGTTATSTLCLGYLNAAAEAANRRSLFLSTQAGSAQFPPTAYPKLFCLTGANYMPDGYTAPSRITTSGPNGPVSTVHKEHLLPNIIHWEDTPGITLPRSTSAISGQTLNIASVTKQDSFQGVITGSDSSTKQCKWTSTQIIELDSSGQVTLNTASLDNIVCT